MAEPVVKKKRSSTNRRLKVRELKARLKQEVAKLKADSSVEKKVNPLVASEPTVVPSNKELAEWRREVLSAIGSSNLTNNNESRTSETLVKPETKNDIVIPVKLSDDSDDKENIFNKITALENSHKQTTKTGPSIINEPLIKTKTKNKLVKKSSRLVAVSKKSANKGTKLKSTVNKVVTSKKKANKLTLLDIQTTSEPELPSTPHLDLSVSPKLSLPINDEISNTAIPLVTATRRVLNILAPLLAIVVIVYLGVYGLRIDKKITGLVNWLPWPAMYVDSNFISMARFTQMVRGLNKLSSPSAAEQLAFEKLVTDTILNHEIGAREIYISSQQIDKEWQKFEAGFGTRQASIDFLNKVYGWSSDQYIDYVVVPELQRLALAKDLNNETKILTQTKTRLQSLRADIVDKKIDFKTAAQRFSDDSITSAQGGSLGWLSGVGLLPPLEARLKTMKVGELSEPVLSDLGYHLLYVDEVKETKTKAGSERMLNVYHILIAPFDIDKWLAEKVAQTTVIPFIHVKR